MQKKKKSNKVEIKNQREINEENICKLNTFENVDFQINELLFAEFNECCINYNTNDPLNTHFIKHKVKSKDCHKLK